MPSITFETAAFSDVIKKAAKVAPTRGAAFDKAAGIVVEFDPSGPVPLAVVRVTNLDVFMMEWVTVAEMSGEAARWRFPSSLLAVIVGSLPIGTGKTVTFESELLSNNNTVIHMRSGRTKAKFYPLPMEYYPTWGAFDPDEMFPATDLGGRMDQVEWAASGSEPDLAGVYLDGKYAIATDRHRLACVPLSIPSLDKPIVLPANVLGSILKATGDIQIGASKNDNLLRIMPDDYTQIKSVVLKVEYPKVTKIIERPLDTTIETYRDQLLEVLNRVTSVGQGDRQANLQIFLGEQEFAMYMVAEEIGSIGDVVEIPGYAEHPRFEMKFTARNLMDGLSKSPNNAIKISYNVGQARGTLRIDDGAGYRAWIMSRSPGKES